MTTMYTKNTNFTAKLFLVAQPPILFKTPANVNLRRASRNSSTATATHSTPVVSTPQRQTPLTNVSNGNLLFLTPY